MSTGPAASRDERRAGSQSWRAGRAATKKAKGASVRPRQACEGALVMGKATFVC